jgi:hypothetical protein
MSKHVTSDWQDGEELSGSITSVSHRSYLSTQHLYAARYASESAYEQELLLISGEETRGMRLRCAVLTAIVESVAFLEAAINEVFQNIYEDRHVAPWDSLNEASKLAMSASWKATNQGRIGVLDKYDLLLQCGKVEPLDRGSNPYQDAHLLIRLRNYVVHFKPEDVPSDGSLQITRSLQGRFAQNAARRRPDGTWSDNDIFGAGCANWTWRTARSLADEVSNRLRLKLNYQFPYEDDPLPK